MKIRHQEITLEDGGILVIQEHNGRLYIKCQDLFPVIEMWNVGLPGINGPNLSFDIKDLVREENLEAEEFAMKTI